MVMIVVVVVDVGAEVVAVQFVEVIQSLIGRRRRGR